MVLNRLQPTDLLSLRATSLTLHNLIHDSSRSLCIGLSDRVSVSHGLSHIPISLPDLSAFFTVSRRYMSACAVASIIAERLARHLSTMDLRADKSALEAWRKKKMLSLEKKLGRSLMILQLYLMFMLDNMNDNERSLEPLDDEEYTSLHNIFLFDEQEFLEHNMSALTETDFMDVTAAVEVFKLTCKARSLPFRMKSPAHPFISVRQLLVLKGLGPFTELLAKDAGLAQQEAILRRLGRSIGQSRRSSTMAGSDLPCPSLHALAGYWHDRNAFFDLKRNNRARDKFVSQQDIWDKSARALMMPKLDKAPETQSAAAWIRKICTQGEKDLKESDVLIGTWDQADAR